MVETIIEVVTGALFELVATGVLLFFAWVGSKVNTNHKLSNISAAKSEVEEAVLQTVTELQQTVVDGLKAAAADGKLTVAEIQQLRQELMFKVLIKLSEPCKKVLRAAGVDLEAFIKGSAEQWLVELKG